MTQPERAVPLEELAQLLQDRGLLRSLTGPGDPGSGYPVIRGVTLDSRLTAAGDLFCAVPGSRADGHEFAAPAVKAGAVAVVAERLLDLPVPQLIVTQVRPALALASAWLHGFPSHRLGVVGVTGTDGKTTTSFLVRAMLEACAQPAGLVGTIEATAGGQVIGGGRVTTPEPPELQAYLAAMVAAGDRWAIVETSSHGLALDKVAEVAYDVAVLTNVTLEHLEFHGTPEAYRAAKRRLFEKLAGGPANPDKGFGKWAVVNVDDPAADEFRAAARAAGARNLGYGVGPTADVRAEEVAESADGLSLAVRAPRWTGRLGLRLSGRFNVHNALAAVAVGEALGLDPQGIRRGLESVTHIPGRMEQVTAGQPFRVVVDYAHTANALAKVLDAVAPLAAARGGRLACVFGSAGERDTVKRPMMGRVAGERCGLIVLTDEDPRGEESRQILGEIAAGAEAAGRQRGEDLLLVPDRQAAIAAALRWAQPGDVVVICGKGHERTIETADGPVPWDDRAAARRALAALGFAAGEGAAPARG